MCVDAWSSSALRNASACRVISDGSDGRSDISRLIENNSNIGDVLLMMVDEVRVVVIEARRQ